MKKLPRESQKFFQEVDELLKIEDNSFTIKHKKDILLLENNLDNLVNTMDVLQADLGNFLRQERKFLIQKAYEYLKKIEQLKKKD